ncbi:hypothetical protein Goari_002856 [Gossypium aridum]|uniref:Uncharacterized protein n=1 Tax=Gossypium aridum TaxID=34290 RepID=A0A7J8Y9M8_GOSAI|nr:hypothetical protein [Gossypium aridum]
MLSQSDDGGGLSLLDDDDSGDWSNFEGHVSTEPSRERNESKDPSKGKVKKHTFGGFSSRRRSSFSNFGYSDSSVSTQGYYPLELPPIFSTSDYNHIVTIHHFPI